YSDGKWAGWRGGRWGERPREPLVHQTIYSRGSSVASPHQHRPRSLASPNQIENFSFERPVFNAFSQVLAHWILLHVEPFVGVALAVAQAMMPAPRLKLPLHTFVFQGERTFPVGNPRLYSELQIARSTEAVKVIGHQ